MKVLNSKLDLNKFTQALYESDNYREYFKNQDVENWIYEYVCSHESDTSKRSKNKQHILYSLIYILNALKPLSAETMKMYLSDMDFVLKEVIMVAYEEKDCQLDETMALALCSNIVIDYTYCMVRKENEVCIDDEFSSKDLTDVFAFFGWNSKENPTERFETEDRSMYIYPDSDIPILNQIISKYPDRIYNELVDIINASNLSFAQQA